MTTTLTNTTHIHTHPTHHTTLPTTDFKHVTLTIDGKRVKVQIWDTAGQERFRNITSTYYRKAQGTLLVYDVTNRDTFRSVDQWMTTIQNQAGDSINKILVGNKLDCEPQRVVSTQEGADLARKYGISFFETSAKSGQNVSGELRPRYLCVAASPHFSSASVTPLGRSTDPPLSLSALPPLPALPPPPPRLLRGHRHAVLQAHVIRDVPGVHLGQRLWRHQAHLRRATQEEGLLLGG